MVVWLSASVTLVQSQGAVAAYRAGAELQLLQGNDMTVVAAAIAEMKQQILAEIVVLIGQDPADMGRAVRG